jgi:hypothetical protein
MVVINRFIKPTIFNYWLTQLEGFVLSDSLSSLVAHLFWAVCLPGLCSLPSSFFFSLSLFWVLSFL